METNTLEPFPALIDTEAAYKPIIRVGQRNFADVPAMIETLESRTDFNPDLLAAEEQMHGVTVADDPEGFLTAHNKLVNDFGAYLQEVYPKALESTIEAVSHYMAKGDATEQARWEQVMRTRVEQFHGIFAADHLTSTKTLGEMRPYVRSILVNSIYALMDPVQARRQVEVAVLPHEIIHLFSTSAVWEKAKDTVFGPIDMPARTGISTIHPSDAFHEDMISHGTWANEAATEDLRAKAFNTEEVAYTRAVALLRALENCDPSLEVIADETVLGTQKPSAVIGKIEELLGPLGVEMVEPLLMREWDPATKTVPYKYDDDTFIDQVVALATPGLKDRLRVALKHHIVHTKPVIQIPGHLESFH